MKEQEEEEKKWFIQQEQDLLKQIISDFQVEEFIGDGKLDEETIKAIYNGENEFSDGTTRDDSGYYEDSPTFIIDDEEARPFAEDPSLQLLIEYQIQVEREAKALNNYQYDKSEFPSLVSADDLKTINRN
mmetsp:Transcript_32806/g.37542  ORF Transcript_32806/g.37542 Transcript_32806/m.37542 type:complete len:130 (+) Transcript_32806:847-1236(+)